MIFLCSLYYHKLSYHAITPATLTRKGTCQYCTVTTNLGSYKIWLVVEPTHLKNMQPSNWVHLPQFSGWKFQKYLRVATFLEIAWRFMTLCFQGTSSVSLMSPIGSNLFRFCEMGCPTVNRWIYLFKTQANQVVRWYMFSPEKQMLFWKTIRIQLQVARSKDKCRYGYFPEEVFSWGGG